MTAYRLDAFDQATLDASGRAVARLTPDGTERWHVTRYAVLTNQATNAQPIPLCTLYVGPPDPGNELDVTYTGNADAGDGDVWLEKGQALTAVWTGGIPATVGTLSVYGERVLY